MAVHPRQRQHLVCPMQMDDLDDVMEIERICYSAPWSRQVFVEELERDWGYLDVVKERTDGKDRAVAFCNYWLVRDEVHLLSVATHSEHRRHGHAVRLLEHIIEFARRHRCFLITLEVRRSNQGAIDMYKQFGFKAVGERPKYYADNHEDAIVMLLEFEQDSVAETQQEER